MTLIQGDCLNVLPMLPPGCVDLVLTDPPYGTTACKWDTVIDLDRMWAQLKRLIRPNGAIVLCGMQPFTSALIMSNVKSFKYCWVWNKKICGNPLNAKIMPLHITEDVCVFGKNKLNYTPVMRRGAMRKKGGSKKQARHVGRFNSAYQTKNDQYYPTTLIEVSNASRRGDRVHPTQKPVALMEYLIKTYTNEGETVLDFTMGSGTTGVACKNTGRDFIGIELDPEYFKTAEARINEHQVHTA